MTVCQRFADVSVGSATLTVPLKRALRGEHLVGRGRRLESFENNGGLISSANRVSDENRYITRLLA